MTSNKKRFLFFFFLLQIFFNLNILKAEEPNLDIDLDSLDDYEKLTRNGDDSEILLDDLIDIIKNINTPLWNYTMPLKGRDVLYLIPQRLMAIERGGLALNLFFNYTDKMSFSPDEALKLSENQLALENFIEALIKASSSDEASSLIPLFKKLTVQERKIGALIQAGFLTGPFTIQLNTSLQISERNFWLNKNDQNQIKNMFKTEGSSFSQKELYKIDYGMGDSRLKLGLNTVNTSSFQLDLGFEGIIPTSRISSIPRIKSYEINFEDFQECLPDVLKSIRDNLINPRLGNGGHWGIGCYTESKISMFHNTINLWNRISFDNLFPENEDRLIASKQTFKTPIDPFILLDPDIATDFIKEFIFPPAYRVEVQPGGIVNFVLSLTFDLTRNWGAGIGYDYYMQQKEQFNRILNKNVEETSLRLSDAQAPRSTQHKILAEIDYTKKYNHSNFFASLGGDYTISSENMGHDWTIFIRVGKSF